MAFTTERLRTLRILSLENPDIGWTFWFPSVIVASIIKIKQTLHQNNSKHQFATVHFICSIDAHGVHSYNNLSTVLTLMYSQCIQFALNLHTRDSVWTVTAETQTNRRGIFLFTFSYLSVVFYTTITKNANLINIPINITENKVDWNIYRSKISAKYSRFRYDGYSGKMTSSTRRGRQRD